MVLSWRQTRNVHLVSPKNRTFKINGNFGSIVVKDKGSQTGGSITFGEMAMSLL